MSVQKEKALKRIRFKAFLMVIEVLAAGLEPARCCHRGILSPLRLPIPPCQQTHRMERVAKENEKSLFPAHTADPATGWGWIRTTEAICSRFTVCPLWPLGNPSKYKHGILETDQNVICTMSDKKKLYHKLK